MNRPISGPMTQASPLNDWEKLILRSADSLGPSLVVYGLAAVSRVARPHPIMNRQIRKIQKDSKDVVAAIRNAPMEKSDKPRIMPFLYPNRFIKYPAGSAIPK